VTRKLFSESQFSRTASRRIKAKVELAKTTEKDFEGMCLLEWVDEQP
jgi:ribosome maturation factor RimP